VTDNDLIAQLLTRVEELERERDEARLDKNEWSRYHQQALFKEAQALQRVEGLEADCASLRETKDTFFRNAEAWETKCNAAWVERDAAEAQLRVLREALEEIARQELIDEMSDEGDIEGGYDACVKRARAALGEKP
jgi:phage shock protein A